MTPPKLLLASTSVYRRELLSRLLHPFDCISPKVDETPHPGELPAALAQRLASAKANAVARDNPQAIVIGSDQTLAVDGTPLGKPGDANRAREQLLQLSGREVSFFTAVCVQLGERQLHHTDTTRVEFRDLDAATVDRYVNAEPAFDCAGSFKCEGLGISLFEAIHTSDPTALIGLPLIATSRLLRTFGLNCP